MCTQLSRARQEIQSFDAAEAKRLQLFEFYKDSHAIPPITHELGSAWDMPALSLIKIKGDNAVMTYETFKKLLEYSHSWPSGVYEGKAWRCHITEARRMSAEYDKVI